MDKGYKTTEFWITLLGQLFVSVLAAFGKVDPEVAAGLFGGGGAVYVSGRSAKKMVEAKKR